MSVLLKESQLRRGEKGALFLPATTVFQSLLWFGLEQVYRKQTGKMDS